MAKLMLVKSGGRLIPATDHDSETFDKLRSRTWYKADLRKARNPDHHRKGMALVQLIHANQDKYSNLEDTLTELKLLTGWYEHHVRMDGTVVYLPKSISFASMDQTDFEEFYDRLIEVARDRFNLTEALEFL